MDAKYTDVTPIMTSNTTPSPYKVTVSNIWDSNYEGYLAFNGAKANDKYWCTASGNNTNQYITIDLANQTAITDFIITTPVTANINSSSSPKNFTLKGSNDGISFNNIKSFTNVSNWSSGVENHFTLDGVANYRYYQLFIESTNGGTYVAICEIRYYFNTEYVVNAYLIKDGDKYYNYDKSNNDLIEVPDASILSSSPISCITNLNDIISHLDKLSDNIQILSNVECTIKTQGIKSDKQLIVASSAFPTKIADNIDHFRATFNITNSSYIKMAISVDNGLSWKTHDGSQWIDLSSIIPLKDYSTLNVDELSQWNTALTEIYTKGFDLSIIESIDFNPIKTESMMFAYVIYQDEYSSTCNNISLEWQFDSNGKMQKMKDNEIDISVSGDKIIINPLINNDMIKVNISNGTGSGSGSDFEEATSEDIENILGKEW